MPSRQDTRVRSLGWEVPLEKGMAIHSSILAWRNPWTENPGRLQSTGSQRIGHDWVLTHRLIYGLILQIKEPIKCVILVVSLCPQLFPVARHFIVVLFSWSKADDPVSPAYSKARPESYPWSCVIQSASCVQQMMSCMALLKTWELKCMWQQSWRKIHFISFLRVSHPKTIFLSQRPS